MAILTLLTDVSTCLIRKTVNGGERMPCGNGLSERTHLLLSFSSAVSLYPQMACFHAPTAPLVTFPR